MQPSLADAYQTKIPFVLTEGILPLRIAEQAAKREGVRARVAEVLSSSSLAVHKPPTPVSRCC